MKEISTACPSLKTQKPAVAAKITTAADDPVIAEGVVGLFVVWA